MKEPRFKRAVSETPEQWGGKYKIRLDIPISYGLYCKQGIQGTPRMMDLGEAAYRGAEGEAATNSQAKGPNPDETLEKSGRARFAEEATLRGGAGESFRFHNRGVSCRRSVEKSSSARQDASFYFAC